jgi:hypothetical protein
MGDSVALHSRVREHRHASEDLFAPSTVEQATEQVDNWLEWPSPVMIGESTSH